MEDELEQQPEKLTREDWIVVGVGLLLVLDLIVFPWLNITKNAPPFSTVLPKPATGAPNPMLGVLAVLAVLLLLADLGFARRTPHIKVPAIGGSRATNRALLALLAAVCIVLKFLLHPKFSQLQWGFYTSVVLVAALVFATLAARAAEPRLEAARHERLKEQAIEREEGDDDEPENSDG